jgi:hypothetical protein
MNRQTNTSAQFCVNYTSSVLGKHTNIVILTPDPGTPDIRHDAVSMFQ